MAHGIETYGDMATYAGVRELPWHRLGTTFEDQDGMTAEQALTTAHLDNWNVRKSPLFTRVDGQELSSDSDFAIVRDNPFIPGQIDWLGRTGRIYDPVQNEDHAEFLNALVDQSGAHFDAALSVNEGREVFITMRKPEHMLIGGVDQVDSYISAFNSHDGTKAFTVVDTQVRTVCKNTQVAALRAARRKVAIRHTAGHGGAVSRAREALDLTFKFDAAFQDEADKMIQETITNAEFDKLVADLFPESEKMSDLQLFRTREKKEMVHQLFESSPTATSIKNTRWGAYQAVTEFTDWFQPMVGQGPIVAQNTRALNAIRGTSDGIKEKAFAALQVA